jgi:hypothetical protein
VKVFDLQCGLGHTFEGWFGSEADYLFQTRSSLVQCPLCGDANIVKKLSAPRLNLSHRRAVTENEASVAPQGQTDTAAALVPNPEVAAAWMHMARNIIAHTDDVGTEFAEVARQIHYGETPERAIRGQTTPDEARSLLDEGIQVLPFVLPEALKKPLH